MIPPTTQSTVPETTMLLAPVYALWFREVHVYTTSWPMALNSPTTAITFDPGKILFPSVIGSDAPTAP
jgi:hypothetical protein